RHFFAMELIDGETLERIIHSQGLELDRFFTVATPLVDALAAAHRRGILHRDLKPDNVMVSRDGRVKVLDFGVAKAMGQEKTEAAGMRRHNLTEEGSVLGTARYMSPEQACREPVDQRTDIFSLGIVLFEMATGSYPFPGRTAAEVLSSILRDEPPLAHTVRRDLRARAAVAAQAAPRPPHPPERRHPSLHAEARRAALCLGGRARTRPRSRASRSWRRTRLPRARIDRRPNSHT